MFTGRSSSEQSKISELKSKIRAGSIVYLYCDFITNPKPKYVVIAYVDFDNDDSLVFIVNSEIRPLIEHDKRLKESQIKLTKESIYTFLDHDSYVNCVEVFDCLDLHYAIRNLEYKGELRREEVNQIISCVENSQTIAKSDKELIIKAMRN